MAFSFFGIELAQCTLIHYEVSAIALNAFPFYMAALLPTIIQAKGEKT
jgi:hypothetical protein